jgi:spore germination cell wall hydrolase CwlJ-like protein
MLSTFCLALVVHTEARGEPLDGQLLVAEVVINRVQSEDYPDTVCAVAFEPHQFSGLVSIPKFEEMLFSPEWETSVNIAIEALQGGTLGSGATHFHNNKVRPSWAGKMTLLGKLGNHTFYKE